MNRMSEVAKLLGVEIGEEFRVEDCGMPQGSIYKLTLNGLVILDGSDMSYPALLTRLLSGLANVVKEPWKPKESEIYYYCKFDEVACTKYTSTHYLSKLNIKLGNYFKTAVEAEEHLDSFIEFVESKSIADWRSEG